MSFTVFTAEFQHESNTFSRVLADSRAFRERYFYPGEQAILERGDANTPLAGFLDIGKRKGWKITHALSAGATPSGPVTKAAYEDIAGIIVDGLKAAGRVDGILLGLHGAMVAEHTEDGEGELLERVRAVVGPDVPIGITLDPHANVTERMARLANIIVAYKTYPHVDVRESAVQAADILARAMKGEIRPVTLRESRPMLEEATGGRTDIGPMVERIAKARAYEQEPDVFAVSVDGAFGNADIAEVGPTVLVTCQGDLEKHRAFIAGIADDIWNRRNEVVNRYFTVEDAAGQARVFDAAKGPLVIADYADNPGGGAYGDSTALLGAMIAAMVQDACFGPMLDPEVVAQLGSHKVGDSVTVSLGGKTDPRFGGEPLTVTGTIRLVSDGHFVGDGPMVGGLEQSYGTSAVLVVDGIEVLVTSVPLQMLDLQQFRAFGIDPAKKRVVGLKSMQHFRAAFEPIASKVVVCDSGALCTLDYARLPYTKIPRPIFPLDRDVAR